MREDMTDITLVLDRSGSMESLQEDTIGSVNRFLADQKEAPGAAVLTLAQFDHEYEVVHAARPIREVPPLDKSTYVPRGNTALLDALGRSILAAGARLESIPEPDRPARVVFVILTDGLENASREFTRTKILEMIEHQRAAYNWQFLYLGANQDAIKEGAALGVPVTTTMDYAPSPQGLSDAVRTASAALGRYRGGLSGQSMGISPDERAEADRLVRESKKKV